MVRRSRFIAVAAALGVGVAALALIPGSQTTAVKADSDRTVALASIASPNPDLLRRLDAEVAPPPRVEPSQEPERVAMAPPVETPVPAAVQTTPDPVLPTGIVGPQAVNLRAGPSTSAQQISVLHPGEAVQTGENSGGWIKVTRSDGSSGWVYSTYLSTGTGTATTKVATAETVESDATTSDLPPAPKRPKARAVVRGGNGDLTDRTARIASPLPAYSGPRDSADTIFTFEPGDEVRIAEVRGNWLRVETDNGISAWIRR